MSSAHSEEDDGRQKQDLQALPYHWKETGGLHLSRLSRVMRRVSGNLPAKDRQSVQAYEFAAPSIKPSTNKKEEAMADQKSERQMQIMRPIGMYGCW